MEDLDGVHGTDLGAAAAGHAQAAVYGCFPFLSNSRCHILPPLSVSIGRRPIPKRLNFILSIADCGKYVCN